MCRSGLFGSLENMQRVSVKNIPASNPWFESKPKEFLPPKEEG